MVTAVCGSDRLMQTIYRLRFYILGLLFVLNILIFWPGYMQSDSRAQYDQAITGQYSDHHPPMMSFIWHYLDQIHQGEGLMFVLQMVLLYSSMAILLLTVDKMFSAKKRLLLSLVPLILPIYPQVLIYAVNIVKDVQYAFSFLLAASVLAYYTIVQKRPSPLVLLGLLLVLIYGAAVKYQGQFCVIVFALWIGGLLCQKRKWFDKILAGLAIYGLIFFSICLINNALVPQKSKNYSWQFVKLYDLAAISIGTHADLIPNFNKTPAYTFQKLQERFKYPTVDPYIYSQDNILMITKDPADMTTLADTWRKDVIAHPVLYLKHRVINMCYALLSRPGYDFVTEYLNKLPHDSMSYTLVYNVSNIIFYTFMSHLPVILLGVGYFILALYSWRASKAAPVLLGFTSLALLMVAILFFMSMAGVPRYTYISIVMIHAAHIFAYKCFADSKKL